MEAYPYGARLADLATALEADFEPVPEGVCCLGERAEPGIVVGRLFRSVDAPGSVAARLLRRAGSGGTPVPASRRAAKVKRSVAVIFCYAGRSYYVSDLLDAEYHVTLSDPINEDVKAMLTGRREVQH